MSRDLGVYLTARSAQFMSGETEVIVPFTMVPVGLLVVCSTRKGRSIWCQRDCLRSLNEDALEDRKHLVAEWLLDGVV